MGKSERAKEARARIADVEGKLARVQIQVTGAPPDLVVRASGREIHELGVALPFDPGPLTIEASARGRVPWVTTIDVPPGPGNQVVVVPVLEPLGSTDAAQAARLALLASADAARSAHLAAERKARWIAAGTVGGAGVVGIVVGGIFGALASQQYKNAQSAGGCGPTTCTSYALFKPGYADARTSAYVSTAAFIAGGAALATGVILAVTVPGDRAAVRLDAGPGPTLTPRRHVLRTPGGHVPRAMMLGILGATLAPMGCWLALGLQDRTQAEGTGGTAGAGHHRHRRQHGHHGHRTGRRRM